MKNKYFLSIVLLCFLGCMPKKQVVNEAEFNKAKWAIQIGKEYPYRDNMLHNLIANKRLNGLKRDSILNLLGQPNRNDSNFIFYMVAQKMLAGVFPLHTKMLVIKFSYDSTVIAAKIYD